MEANGSPLPVFETDAERSYLTVILPVHEKFTACYQNIITETAEEKHKMRRSKNDLRDSALDFLKEHEELSASEITKLLGYKYVSASLRDVLSIEATGQYNGVYHILGGIISPIDGIGPSDLSIDPLVSRVESGGIKEVIFFMIF